MKSVIACPQGGTGFPRVSDTNSDENKKGDYSLRQVGSVVVEIEAHARTVADVGRIRRLLQNASDKPDKDLLALLQRLKSMGLSTQILKETEIEEPVHGLQEHRLMHIRGLVQDLINDWKNTKANWQESILHSTNTSVPMEYANEEIGGLPVPPLDEWAFFTPLPSSMSFSEFFDGIDDNGAEDIQGSSILNVTTEPQCHVQPNLNKNKMNRRKEVDGLSKGHPEKQQQPQPQLKSAREEIKVTKEIDRLDRSLKQQQQRQPMQKRNCKELPNGLSVPPLDEWAFFMPLPSSMSFSEFFDGIDDIGADDIQDSNILNVTTEPQPHVQPKLSKNKMNRSKEVDGLSKGRPEEQQQPQPKLKCARGEIKVMKENDRVDRSLKQQQQHQPMQKRNGKELKMLEAVMKPKSYCAAPKLKEHTKLSKDCKFTEEHKTKKQVSKSDDCKLIAGQVDASSTKAPFELKLQTTKRKLHESYSRIENAKKKRNIQLIDVKDLPKPEISPGNRRQYRGPMSKKL